MVNRKRQVVLVAHNVRSALNVGSLLRTAEGLGAEKIYLTGYTPYPESPADTRLPHLKKRVALRIHKTALGAEYFIPWEHMENLNQCIEGLEADGYTLLALEQTPQAGSLAELKPAVKTALVVGNEVSGLDKATLRKIKRHVHIPMSGRKESFNVAVAAAIALYHLRYIDKNSA